MNKSNIEKSGKKNNQQSYEQKQQDVNQSLKEEDKIKTDINYVFQSQVRTSLNQNKFLQEMINDLFTFNIPCIFNKPQNQFIQKNIPQFQNQREQNRNYLSQSQQQTSQNTKQKQYSHQQKERIIQGKKAVVDKFMSLYDQIADQTIRKHNKDIYQRLKQFLRSDKYLEISNEQSDVIHGVNGLHIRGIGSNTGGQFIPTCLVITSNESSSSIETQFRALCQEIKTELNSINIIIDDKKCGNIKQSIEHIHNRLKEELEINDSEQQNQDLRQNKNDDQNADEVKLIIKQNENSSDDEKQSSDADMNIENNHRQQQSSNHVSTLKDTTFIDTKFKIDSEQPNGKIDGNNYDFSKQKKNGKKFQTDDKFCKTRGQLTLQNQQNQKVNLGDEYETQLANILERQQLESDILQKETFLGIKNIIQNLPDEIQMRPIVLIIKNIKLMQIQILNDLIHLIDAYRRNPHNLNLNLILGVQNNNRDEIHQRISVQNCVKMTIKPFYFPSMKLIILESINNLLLSRDNILTFEPQIIKQMIQSINLYGMSVDRFKHILKVLLTEHIYENDEMFFLHFIPLKLCSKGEFEKIYKPKIEKVISKGFDEYYGHGSFQNERDAQITFLVERTLDYIKKRRHYLKAFEVIKDIATKGYIQMEQSDIHDKQQNDKEKSIQGKNKIDEHEQKIKFQISEKEIKIFQYQFTLNYMSKATSEERTKFMFEFYSKKQNFQDTFLLELLPTLQYKIEKKKVVQQVSDQEHQHYQLKQEIRKSTFILKQYEKVKKMISGQYQFEKQQKMDEKMSKNMTLQINTQSKQLSRSQKLLEAAKTPQKSVNKNKEDQEMIDYDSPSKLLPNNQSAIKVQDFSMFQPKTLNDWNILFFEWFQQFQIEYINYDLKNKNYEFQAQVFHVKGENFINKMNADISGNMTSSIIDSMKIMTNSVQQYLSQIKLSNTNKQKKDDQSQIEQLLQETNQIRSFNGPAQVMAAKQSRSQTRMQDDDDDVDMKPQIEIEKINFKEENCKVIMEILRYFGKDVNILEVFQAYKQIYIKHLNLMLIEKKKTLINEDKCLKNIKILLNKINQEQKTEKNDKLTKIILDEKELQDMFEFALREMKYLGYLQNTNKSTFIFRKNYFGKHQINRNAQKSQELQEKEQKIIKQQFGDVYSQKN